MAMAPGLSCAEGLRREALRSLAMTNLGASYIRRGRIGKLAIASLPCHCEEGVKPDAAISSVRHFDSPGFPVLRPVLADCRALLRKARNDKLGGLSHSEGAQRRACERRPPVSFRGAKRRGNL